MTLGRSTLFDLQSLRIVALTAMTCLIGLPAPAQEAQVPSSQEELPAQNLANPPSDVEQAGPEKSSPTTDLPDEGASTSQAPAEAEMQEGITETFSAPSATQKQPASSLEALSQDPKQWPMATRDYANHRYSALDQIKIGNVHQLQVAWTFSLGTNRGQEAAPLIIDNMLYVVGPYPNRVFALDATNGELKWTYTPKPNPAAQGVACCDVVNRGLAYNDGRIFLNTLDAHAVAIDAASGKEIWHTKLGEINKGETITMAPLVARGKVYVGNSGGEMGVRGWLTALDEKTGEIVWRAYSTGPDSDVLIGEDFKPFYDSHKGKDLGVSTWPAEHWKNGGGTVWGWLSYDPELNLIFYGTANPGPWNSKSAAWRQSLDHNNFCARCRHRRGQVGLSS